MSVHTCVCVCMCEHGIRDPQGTTKSVSLEKPSKIRVQPPPQPPTPVRRCHIPVQSPKTGDSCTALSMQDSSLKSMEAPGMRVLTSCACSQTVPGDCGTAQDVTRVPVPGSGLPQLLLWHRQCQGRDVTLSRGGQTLGQGGDTVVALGARK